MPLTQASAFEVSEQHTGERPGDLHAARPLSAGRDPVIAAEADGAWIAVIQKMDETYAELVTQQVALEEKNAALEEAQAFIAGVMASMTDVLIACDLNGRIEQVNLAAERIFGPRQRSLTECRVADLLADSSPTSFADVLAAVERRQRITDREFTFLTADGELPVSVNGAVRFDSRAVSYTHLTLPTKA